LGIAAVAYVSSRKGVAGKDELSRYPARHRETAEDWRTKERQALLWLSQL
jgi:hypothetical protein